MTILRGENSKIGPNQLQKGCEVIVEKSKNEPCLKKSFCFQDLSFKSNPLLWLTADANANGCVGP